MENSQNKNDHSLVERIAVEAVYVWYLYISIFLSIVVISILNKLINNIKLFILSSFNSYTSKFIVDKNDMLKFKIKIIIIKFNIA